MTNIITSKTRNRLGSTHSKQGKGGWRRAQQVTKEEFDANWERTFGKGKRDSRTKKTAKRARG